MRQETIQVIGKECVGCTACVNECPVSCITMQLNEEGFYFPRIDDSKCIQCGKCKKVCPVPQVCPQRKIPIPLAMMNRDYEVRKTSSSGGIYYRIAREIMKDNGSVYAVVLDEKLVAVHKKITSHDLLCKSMKSKYVQSDMGNVLLQMKKELKEDKKVLFVGTPCQVYGLHCFLGKEYNNLYTIDFICHAVPSPKIWGEYIDSQEKSAQKKVKNVSFRDISVDGWKNFGMCVEFSDGSCRVDTQDKNLYMQGFLKGYFDRECCYDCRFKGLNRRSDLTLGDFWQVEKYLKGFNDNVGTSLVYVNTEKGKELIHLIKGSMYIRKLPRKTYLEYNVAYNHSIDFSEHRKIFYKKYLRGKEAMNIIKVELKKGR